MYIKVKVIAEAKKESIHWQSLDTVLLSIREKPQNGIANKRILEILSSEYKIQGKHVSLKIVSGHQSPSKIISVTEYAND